MSIGQQIGSVLLMLVVCVELSFGTMPWVPLSGVIYNGDEYSLFYQSGLADHSELSDHFGLPEQLGIHPRVMITTAGCWDIFHPKYELAEEGFFLRELTLTVRDGHYPQITGQLSSTNTVSGMRGDFKYTNLSLAIPFTGTLRIGKDAIRRRGWFNPKSSMYKTVLSVRLKDGAVVEVLDQSADIEKRRRAWDERIQNSEERRRNPSRSVPVEEDVWLFTRNGDVTDRQQTDRMLIFTTGMKEGSIPVNEREILDTFGRPTTKKNKYSNREGVISFPVQNKYATVDFSHITSLCSGTLQLDMAHSGKTNMSIRVLVGGHEEKTRFLPETPKIPKDYFTPEMSKYLMKQWHSLEVEFDHQPVMLEVQAPKGPPKSFYMTYAIADPAAVLLEPLRLNDSSAKYSVTVARAITSPSNGKSYCLLRSNPPEVGLTWTESALAAEELGGHLVAVNSAAEYKWILETFIRSSVFDKYIWIGLSDVEEEGVFCWSNGDTLDFEAWYSGEPNDLYGGEDYIQIYNFSGGNYKWNDTKDVPKVGAHPISAIVEISPE